MMNKTKGLLLIFGLIVICCLRGTAQDSVLVNHGKWHFGIGPLIMKDFGQQANFFRGLGTFGIADLLALPTIKSELYSKTGYNYTFYEWPPLLKYEMGIGADIKLLYEGEEINWVLSGGFLKLNTSGYFTLSATNPSNPFGDDLIKTELISGVERRTWIKGGMQTRSEINDNYSFIFEITPAVYFQKALKNNVVIEGSTYSILINNPGNVPVRSSYTGYGISLGPGVQSRFKGNRLAQLGINTLIDKLKMVDTKKLNLSLCLYLSILI